MNMNEQLHLCPHCGYDVSITYKHEEEYIVRIKTCVGCGFSWEEVFTFTSNELASEDGYCNRVYVPDYEKMFTDGAYIYMDSGVFRLEDVEGGVWWDGSEVHLDNLDRAFILLEPDDAHMGDK